MGLRLLNHEEAAEYSRFLESYHPSGQVVFDFARSNFGIIAGPTGAGKDTIRQRLIQMSPDIYRPILSTTTRPPRPGEQDGVDYHYRDLKFFEEGLDERRFLQAEVVMNQQISGLDFGDIASLDSMHYGLGILVVQAEKRLRELNSKLKTMFIVPPPYQEWINRIQSSRSMKEDEIMRRMTSAKGEIEFALKDDSYYLLTNDNLDITTRLANRFFQAGERDSSAVQLAKIAMQQILNELSTYKINE